jgi:tRNA-2-methylthio-N6-dimethylallyladenosine synthase
LNKNIQTGNFIPGSEEYTRPEEIAIMGKYLRAGIRSLSDSLDLENDLNFAELLEAVAKIGIERVRFVTSHPWNFTDEMINTIAKYDNIMPYIHLPLQSGSDSILRLMGRRYTKSEYLELFNKIKSTIPNAAVTTDIIVGFPNETDEDFEDTMSVVEECKYDGAFTFIYSPREGTPAAKMEDSIPMEVKEERLQRLNKLVNEYSNMNNQKYLNTKQKVLLVGVSEKDTNKLYGYTETMKLVNVECDHNLLGEIVDVTITDAKSFSLDGKVEK